MSESIALNKIRIDGGTQPRAAISEQTYRDYAAYMTEGKKLPPPDVFFDGTEYWLADGYHRFFAAKFLERTCLTCEVHAGTRRDAVLFSVGANHGHGLQRTNADKRKAVMTLLSDDEWRQKSNPQIATICGVGDEMVRVMRASLPEKGSEKHERTYTTRHGTEATMKVAKIGRGKEATRKAAFEARQAAAAEGVSQAVSKRLPSKKDAELIARVMHAMEGIINTLEHIDVAALATDPHVDLWRDTSSRMVSILRAFARNLERKTA